MAKVSCVDISEFQQGINFNKMKSDGIKAVIIRAGYGRESSQKDSMFESHYKNAKSENMMIGVYWYSYADSVGGVAQTIESDMYFWGSPVDGPLYVQLFWVSGKELPDGYHLTCIDDPSFDISYEELLEAFRTAVQLREAS